MKVVFDDITEFIVDEVIEKIQDEEYYIQCRAIVSSDFDFMSNTQNIYSNHPNGFVNKIDIYDTDDTLISSINDIYQIQIINKAYRSKTDIFLIIELKLRPDLNPQDE